MKPNLTRAAGALGQALWSFRREMAWVGLFSVFTNLLAMTPALYMLQVFDRVMLSGSGMTLIALTLVALLFFATMAFSDWIRSRLLVRAGVRLDNQLSSPLFRAAFSATLSGGGAKPLQAFTDLTQLRQFLTRQGVFALFDTPWTLIYIAVLYVMHPWLGAAALLFSLVMVALALWSHWFTAARQARASDGVVDINAFLGAKLRNAETVEALGMAPHLRALWLALHERQLRAQATASAATHQTQAAVKFTQYAQQSLMLALGAMLVIDGQIGVGAMVASNMLVSLALRPMGSLVGSWRQFTEARQCYGRLDQLLSLHPEPVDQLAAGALQGQVTLQGLKATAMGRKSPILAGLDAEFQAGELIAIVGPSGAGKSTLARCIVGIWPQTSGAVLLDGHAVADWPREGLGPQIGYLPQDVEMLDGSIAENIARFGAVDSPQVIEAATRTGIHDMTLRLPQGYDTPMGEAGQLMSGGQRQRIGLARALYGKPRLIVLDEPTSSLDDVGQSALVRALGDLREQGCTVFMVVHQRELLGMADRVLVLKDGVIAQNTRRPQAVMPATATVTPGAALLVPSPHSPWTKTSA